MSKADHWPPPDAADWVQDIVVGLMQSESVADAKEAFRAAVRRMVNEAVADALDRTRRDTDPGPPR